MQFKDLINSQSLEDTRVRYISQKYTLEKHTLEKYTLIKYTLDPGTRRPKQGSPPLLTPAVTGNTRQCTLLDPAVQKYNGCTKVILIGAQQLSGRS